VNPGAPRRMKDLQCSAGTLQACRTRKSVLIAAAQASVVSCTIWALALHTHRAKPFPLMYGLGDNLSSTCLCKIHMTYTSRPNWTIIIEHQSIPVHLIPHIRTTILPFRALGVPIPLVSGATPEVSRTFGDRIFMPITCRSNRI
jgi:hypothetical protein